MAELLDDHGGLRRFHLDDWRWRRYNLFNLLVFVGDLAHRRLVFTLHLDFLKRRPVAEVGRDVRI